MRSKMSFEIACMLEQLLTLKEGTQQLCFFLFFLLPQCIVVVVDGELRVNERDHPIPLFDIDRYIDGKIQI